MIKSIIIDSELRKEKNHPTWSHHHLNSYITNLPISKDNSELRSFLKYFKTPEVYLPLYERAEFKNGLSIDVRVEMTDQYDENNGIVYRESLWHNHDFFEMVFVYEGSCHILMKNDDISMKEKDLCLFNLQTVHKLVMDNPAGVVFNILVSRRVLVRSFFSAFSTADPVSAFYVNSLNNIAGDAYMIFTLPQEAMVFVYDLIEENILKKPMYENAMELDFRQLLIRLGRICRTDAEAQAKASPERIDIDAILAYIQANFKTVTLSSLAEHFGYTTRSMMRFLKKFTNRSFSEIVREYRLITACTYLRDTNRPIDDIAISCGFNERAYFDKVFKQAYHMTPHEFRYDDLAKNM